MSDKQIQIHIYPRMRGVVILDNVQIDDPPERIVDAAYEAIGSLESARLCDAEFVDDVMWEVIDADGEVDYESTRCAAFVDGKWKEGFDSMQEQKANRDFLAMVASLPRSGEIAGQGGCFEDWFGGGTQRTPVKAAELLDELIRRARLTQTSCFVESGPLDTGDEQQEAS